MSYKLYDDTDIQDIADAIREKNGSQDTYKVRQMSDAIRAISSGLSDEIKQALLDCFQKVAWIDDQGQDYYDALYDALYPPADLSSISCVYTQSGTVYDTDSLDSLKSDLVVTAHYSDQSTQTVTTYTLSGTLAEGTSTITVMYGGKSTTFDVTVSAVPADLIYSEPITMVKSGGSTGAWDTATETGYIYSVGASSYPSFILNGLLFKYSEVNNKTLHLKCDLTISGGTSSTTGSGAIVAIGLYTKVNPTDNSTQRKANTSIFTKLENGTFSLDEEIDMSTAFSGSSLDNYYLGLSVFANASGTAFRVDISNVLAEVY